MSLATLQARIEHAGGSQLDRIRKQKWRSFRAALKNDYNSRFIRCIETNQCCRALINSDSLKSDYDKKVISVDFAMNMNSGDTFECLDDSSYWMIYLPELTEIAYLRAEIIRCRYQVTIGNNDYWIYFQGPTETALRWNNKDSLNWNDLNLSGTIYIKQTPETLEYFNRFTKIKLAGHTWQVKVVDSITVPGIIELEVQEYFDSITEDIIEATGIIPLENDIKIIGESKVYPYDTYNYSTDVAGGTFSIDSDNAKIVSQNNGKCKIEIVSGRSGKFTLVYTTSDEIYELPIQILSL